MEHRSVSCKQAAKWTVTGTYLLGLVAPLAGIASLSRAEISTWLETGLCPAGPMDRPAQLCGPVDFVAIVLLGGWAAFVVIPILVIWWTGCTAALVAAVALLRRRSRRPTVAAPDDPLTLQ